MSVDLVNSVSPQSSHPKFKAAQAALQTGAKETGKAFLKSGLGTLAGAVPGIGFVLGPLVGLGLDLAEAGKAVVDKYQSVLSESTIQAVPQRVACPVELVPAFAAKAA
ncbi:hypothetical protein HN928_00215 [bacterium]|jgi:hypothetical protein|nr:hypothetical protein [bacterium]